MELNDILMTTVFANVFGIVAHYASSRFMLRTRKYRDEATDGQKIVIPIIWTGIGFALGFGSGWQFSSLVDYHGFLVIIAPLSTLMMGTLYVKRSFISDKFFGVIEKIKSVKANRAPLTFEELDKILHEMKALESETNLNLIK